MGVAHGELHKVHEAILEWTNGLTKNGFTTNDTILSRQLRYAHDLARMMTDSLYHLGMKYPLL